MERPISYALMFTMQSRLGVLVRVNVFLPPQASYHLALSQTSTSPLCLYEAHTLEASLQDVIGEAGEFNMLR